MFTRKSDRAQRAFEPLPAANTASAYSAEPPRPTPAHPLVGPPAGAAAAPAQPAPAQAAPRSGDMTGVSVIGRDLTILGAGLKIISRGTLHINGEVLGDVIGTEIVINEGARVAGLVNAERVDVRGSVAGTVKAETVVLSAKAEVEGDIHHRMLTVEQGAVFIGKSSRPADVADLAPNLDPQAHVDQGVAVNGAHLPN